MKLLDLPIWLLVADGLVLACIVVAVVLFFNWLKAVSP